MTDDESLRLKGIFGASGGGFLDTEYSGTGTAISEIESSYHSLSRRSRKRRRHLFNHGLSLSNLCFP